MTSEQNALLNIFLSPLPRRSDILLPTQEKQDAREIDTKNGVKQHNLLKTANANHEVVFKEANDCHDVENDTKESINQHQFKLDINELYNIQESQKDKDDMFIENNVNHHSTNPLRLKSSSEKEEIHSNTHYRNDCKNASSIQKREDFDAIVNIQHNDKGPNIDFIAEVSPASALETSKQNMYHVNTSNSFENDSNFQNKDKENVFIDHYNLSRNEIENIDEKSFDKSFIIRDDVEQESKSDCRNESHDVSSSHKYILYTEEMTLNTNRLSNKISNTTYSSTEAANGIEKEKKLSSPIKINECHNSVQDLETSEIILQVASEHTLREQNVESNFNPNAKLDDHELDCDDTALTTSKSEVLDEDLHIDDVVEESLQKTNCESNHDNHFRDGIETLHLLDNQESGSIINTSTGRRKKRKSRVSMKAKRKHDNVNHPPSVNKLPCVQSPPLIYNPNPVQTTLVNIPENNLYSSTSYSINHNTNPTSPQIIMEERDNISSSITQQVSTAYYDPSLSYQIYHEGIQDLNFQQVDMTPQIPNYAETSVSSEMLGKRKNRSSNEKKPTKIRKKNRKNVLGSNEKLKRTPCHFYIQGRCSKGADCDFRHEGVKVNRFNHIPCQFFLQGVCRKGDDCGYSHDLSQCPCKFHHLYGYCQKGNLCQWSHAEITPEQLRDLKNQQKSEIEKQMESQQEEQKKNQESFLKMIRSQTSIFPPTT